MFWCQKFSVYFRFKPGAGTPDLHIITKCQLLYSRQVRLSRAWRVYPPGSLPFITSHTHTTTLVLTHPKPFHLFVISFLHFTDMKQSGFDVWKSQLEKVFGINLPGPSEPPELQQWLMFSASLKEANKKL